MKIKKTDRPGLSIVSKVGVFSLSLLCAFSAVYFYSPVIKSNATNTGDMEVGFILKPYLNLTLDKSELSLSGKTGTFVQGNVNVTVATNSSYGYSVSLEDTDNNTDLISETLENNDKFESSFAETVTSSTMPENSWGYSLNATDFYEIAPFGMPDLIGKSNEATTSESENATTRVDFGAKIGDFTIADQYSDQILFTAYVNGQDGTAYEINDDGSIDEKSLNTPYTPTYNMQNFECETLNVGQSAKAIDVRDNNRYIIRRLSDGSCWMMDSLRIKNATLTPEDSDVESTFVLKQTGDLSQFNDPGEDVDTKTIDAVYTNDNGTTFYSWYTVSAGSSANVHSYATQEEFLNVMESPNADFLSSLDSSICPKGWHLPRIGDIASLTGTSSSSAVASSAYIDDVIKMPPDGFIVNGSFRIEMLVGRSYSGDEPTDRYQTIDTRGDDYIGGSITIIWPGDYFGIQNTYAIAPSLRMINSREGYDRFGRYFTFMPINHNEGDYLTDLFKNGSSMMSMFKKYNNIVIGAQATCMISKTLDDGEGGE